MLWGGLKCRKDVAREWKVAAHIVPRQPCWALTNDLEGPYTITKWKGAGGWLEIGGCRTKYFK